MSQPWAFSCPPVLALTLAPCSPFTAQVFSPCACLLSTSRPHAHLADSSLLPLQYQCLNPMSKRGPRPSRMPTCFHPNPRPCVGPAAHAHLSRCSGTAGYGSRCPSPHPQCSSTPAMSRSAPGCCHMHLEPLCQNSTPAVHCPQRPA